ncbi:helicase-related protein [Bacillus cereus]|uniref:DNA 3'-5' helicase n=1 Tax=Bacillus cereus TaxID=1396 RepID=A0A2B2LY73_BACCE|nr:helicase-related protein [Bacillus cereus]PFQ47868.1 helicase [Bacillus cereus]
MLKQIFRDSFLSLREKKQDTNTVIYIFKGFPHDWLQEILDFKLLTIPLDTSLLSLDLKKQQNIIDFFKQASLKNHHWLTYEEFQTIPPGNISIVGKPIIINNNFYDAYYPLSYSIPPEHLDAFHDSQVESKNNNEANYLFEFYSSIEVSPKKNIYVSYVTKEDFEELNLFNKINELQLEEISEKVDYVELGGEIPFDFLDMVSDLIQSAKINSSIYISFGEKSTKNYIESLNLDKLTLLYSYIPNLKVYKVLKQVQQNEIPSEMEAAYLDILKRYWGYDSYRSLKVYKNVDSLTNKKEIIEVSQIQIIHDVISQSEAAKKNGTIPNFRDIFVTAPTGAGKSIMFQVPAIYLAEKYEYLTIVISPLIGLMKDQVYNLQEKNITFSATINSEISPVEKANIADRISNKEISILYISPETLLSRADISALIGDREIGLFIIDEAHIVTTWGKAFRADYWYLGDYLQKIRRGKTYQKNNPTDLETKHQFPIATFTATAIYGGIEDMYAETRDSLILNNPINYFGYVKRDNIEVQINPINSNNIENANDKEYLAAKHKFLLEQIKYELVDNRKVLIYFPLIKSILSFKEYLERHASDNLLENIAIYHGRLKKEQKNENFLRFKDGNARIMLATKAFGMGIDIPDIDTVLHFAPTGNVCDYVQEIGRAARGLEMGLASFTYLKEDFKHVNRLHGISTIKKYQLIQVMQKVLDLYKQRSKQNKSRHLLVSSEEFHYIFQSKKDDAFDSDLIDNQLKTALLIIEKGFINSPLKYSPITARPRSMFAVEYFKVFKEDECDLLKNYKEYVEKYREVDAETHCIYKINLDHLWRDKFSHLSFPNFKRILHEKGSQLKDKLLEKLDPIFIISSQLQAPSQDFFMYKLEENLNKLNEVLSQYIMKRKVFEAKELQALIKDHFSISSYKAEAFVSQLLESIINYESIMNKTNNQRTYILNKNEYRLSTTYRIHPSFNTFIKFITQETSKLLHYANKLNEQGTSIEYLLRKQDSSGSAKLFLVLGLLEMFELLVYEVKGGDHPQIYIRVGSEYQIEKTLQNPAGYNNSILKNVHDRHYTSVEMLRYLFENDFTSDDFWNHIENYFLGDLPDKVVERINTKKQTPTNL